MEARARSVLLSATTLHVRLYIIRFLHRATFIDTVSFDGPIQVTDNFGIQAPLSQYAVGGMSGLQK